jgi:alpha-1,2-mannosyltransferase
VSVLALAREAGLGERFPALAGRRILLVLVAVLAMPGVLTELVNGNVHLYLLGLLTAAWLGIRRGDGYGERVAGVAIGIATLVKIFPGLAILWFLVTRRWTAAAWSVVGAAALSVITLPITGLQPWLEFPRALANLAAPIDPSVSFAPTVWLAPYVGFSIARIVVTVTGVGIVAWSALRQDARTSFAVTVVASILITPALWSSYFSLLVIPIVLALGSGASVTLLGIVYILLSAGVDTGLGDLAWVVARLLPTIGALLLLAVLLRLEPTEARTGADRRTAPSAA